MKPYPLVAAVLAAVSCSSAAQATLIDNDYYTTDTATGLDWLDVSQTAGKSYNEVTGELSGILRGWHYATGDQLFQFWYSLGLPPLRTVTLILVDNYTYTFYLDKIQLLGPTAPGQIIGVYADFVQFGTYRVQDAAEIDAVINQGKYYTASNIGSGGWCVNCANPHVGSWLVRDTVGVPGPLAGSGLPGLIFATAGLLAWFRRKKQASQYHAA